MTMSEISETEEIDRVGYTSMPDIQDQAHRDKPDRAFEYEKTVSVTLY